MDCQPGDAQQVGGIKINPNPELQRHLQRHRDRRERGANRYTEDEEVIFSIGDNVYSINSSDVIDNTQIGTILNLAGYSLFRDPQYEVEFKNVSNGVTTTITKDQSDLVLVLPEDLMQGGGKHRKISKKNRISKHRKSKHRKSKHRISKHRKSKHRKSKHIKTN